MYFRTLTTAVLFGGTPRKKSLMKLFQFQKYAARLVFDDFESNSQDLLGKLKWLPINHRVDFHKAVLVFKSLNGLAPDYLFDYFEFRRNNHYNVQVSVRGLYVSSQTSHRKL